MTKNIFPLNERKDVEEFEHLFNLYLEKYSLISLAPIPLTKAFDKLQLEPERGRIFAALVDIKITMGLLWVDIVAFGKEIDVLLNCEEIEGESEAKRTESFMARMHMHSHANAFILRYRSIWDKIMGLIVLLIAPQEYENYFKSKSRKRSFRKIVEKFKKFPIEFVDATEEMLSKFDNTYRTAEAHGTGVLRKTSFIWIDFPHERMEHLIRCWNALNAVVKTIGNWFDTQKEISN